MVHRAAASVILGNSVEMHYLQPNLDTQTYSNKTLHLTRPQAIHMHTTAREVLFEIYIKRLPEAQECNILYSSIPVLNLITNIQAPI